MSSRWSLIVLVVILLAAGAAALLLAGIGTPPVRTFVAGNITIIYSGREPLGVIIETRPKSQEAWSATTESTPWCFAMLGRNEGRLELPHLFAVETDAMIGMALGADIVERKPGTPFMPTEVIPEDSTLRTVQSADLRGITCGNTGARLGFRNARHSVFMPMPANGPLVTIYVGSKDGRIVTGEQARRGPP